MKKAVIALAGLCLMMACSGKKENNSNSDSTPLSIRMARSEMARVPNTLNLDFRTSPCWNYSTGLELYAFQQVAERYNDREIFDYVYSYVDTMVQGDGSIFNYEVEEYNLDNVNSGKLLFRIYDQTGEERFKKASDLLRSQLQTQPRTGEGGFWHKQIYEHQMWLDGLYMGAPFLAEYAKRTGEDVAEDMVNQFLIVGRHTYDADTRLYRHAWDESHEMFWADKETGRSQHAWGRANGWYMMAMVDILEFIPEGTKGRDEVLTTFQTLAQTLLEYRDSTTGMWFQVLDQPYREGNYVESSCSAMFIYAFLKGARMGYLAPEFREIGEEAFQQFVDTFITTNDDQTISLTRGCAVAGLGGKQMRDGSFDYYIGEPIRDNDPKAIGPFVMACLEVEK